MVIFHWTRELETGVELIDKQHKKIIECANRFFIRYKCGAGAKDISECLGFLRQYVMYHFQAEEAYQVECGYPDYRGHQAQHMALTTELKFQSVRLEASVFAPEEVETFYKFLMSWLKLHILSEDVRFARYYRDANGGDKQTRP